MVSCFDFHKLLKFGSSILYCAQFKSVFFHVHFLNDGLLTGKFVWHQVKNDVDKYEQLVTKHELSVRVYFKYCPIVLLGNRRTKKKDLS